MAFESPSDSRSSSPLSSLASRSPSPPNFYPSPSSSQDLPESSIPTSAALSLDGDGDGDGDGDSPPPAKKRKIAQPKPRTTEYLDLRTPSSDAAPPPQDLVDLRKSTIDTLLKVLRKRRKIVVIAGAGISVSAGIPDFRSSTGLFRTLRTQHKLKASGKHLFDASVYKSDASTSSFHDMVRSLSHLVASTKPTAFHHLLATLAHEGRLLRLYSQNVDGIDTSLPPLHTRIPLGAKGPWPRTVQLHGGLEKMVCQKCHHLSDFEPALFDGPEPPSCRECEQLDSVRTTIAGKRSHGIGKLRPRIVLYNEYNPDEEAIGAVSTADLRSRPDAIIVVGTSLKVPGVRRIVKEMCGVVRGRRDGVAIWINNGPEPPGREFDSCWDLVIRGDADEVARLADLSRWDAQPVGPDDKVDDREAEALEVVMDTPKKTKQSQLVQGVLTPVASPRSEGTAALDVEAMKPSLPMKLGMLAKSKPLSTKTAIQKGKSASSKPKARKPKPNSKRAAASKVTGSINQAFKVTKSVALGDSKPLLHTSSLSGPSKENVTSDLPVSSGLVQNFTQTPEPTRDTTPNDRTREECLFGADVIKVLPMHGYLPPIPDPAQMVSSAQVRRNEIVSPRGPIPSDLNLIIHQS